MKTILMQEDAPNVGLGITNHFVMLSMVLTQYHFRPSPLGLLAWDIRCLTLISV
jgi:hypothetical protein